MIDRDKLKYVIDGLVDDDYNYPAACRILDAFEKKANCLADYDVLGELSILAKHSDLRLRAAHYAYSHSTSPEQVFSARENLYKVYNALNQPEKAIFYIQLNLSVKPNDIDTLTSLAGNLALMNRKQEADLIIDNLTSNDPKKLRSIEAMKFRRQMSQGKTAKGIINFMNNDKLKNSMFEETLKLKYWDGGAYPGKTIVVHTEGGVGDEIINIRFLDRLRDYGMKPILYSGWHMYRPDLVTVFERHGYDVYTVPYFFKPEYLWTHMMSLPGYLGLNEQELWRGPYLTPLRQEKNRITDNKFKIGIKCSGNPYFDQEIYRAIPLEQMMAAMPKGASIYFFDKEQTDSRCINLKDKLNTWDDTLDYIDQMDVIVSSCTSLVHAAGALGKRTIVITPIAEYLIWTSSRTDESSPWYGDNFYLIKQQHIRDWSIPLARVNQLLTEWSANG